MEAAKQIVEYSIKDAALQEIGKVEAGLSELRQTYLGKVYDCTTAAGMAAAKADRSAIRVVRYKVPKIEEAVTKQLNDLKRDIKTKAGNLIEELLSIETISDGPIKAEEVRKEQERVAKAEAERLRITNTLSKIEQIKAVVDRAAAWKAEAVGEVIIKLEQIVVAEQDYQEFLPMAIEARDEALVRLNNLYATKFHQEEEAERLQQEKAEADARLEAERVERDRLAEIERKRLQEEMQRLQLEREAFERDKAAEAERKEEEDRVAGELRKAEEAALEQKRAEAQAIVDQAEEKAREEARRAAVAAEQDRVADEKARKLAEAKCADAVTAFAKILDICRDRGNYDDLQAREEIALIAEAMYVF